MRIWRITPQRHRAVALCGFGARKTGGRWNPQGVAIAYTAESAELAVLESLVHTGTRFPTLRRLLIEYVIPDDAIMTLQKLPKEWDLPEPYLPQVQRVGAKWVDSGKSLALRVPSATLPIRANVLINPSHARFAEIIELSAQPFTWPTRLQAYIQKLATPPA